MYGSRVSVRHGIRCFSTTQTRLTNYGFVGLGEMGQHMARHIYNKLEPLDKMYVFDVQPAQSEKFVKAMGEMIPANKNKLKQLQALPDFVNKVDSQMDFICSMVPEGKHVKAVFEELVKAYKSCGKDLSSINTAFVDSSTIDIPTSVEVHNYVKKEIPHFDFIDAPVSGGVAGARKGTLAFMLSKGSHEDMSPNLTKLLSKMGTNIFPCGENHGVGLAAKLSNNYLLAVTNLAVADSFQLAKSFGLDLQKFAKLVAVSTGKSWASVDNCPIPGVYPKENQMPADRGYKGGFVTKLTRKDLVLATDSAKSRDRFLYLGETSKKWYDAACEHEEIANKDLGVLFEWLGELSEKDK